MDLVEVRRAAEHLPAPRRGRGFLPFITIGERLLELPLDAVPGSDEEVEVAESILVTHRAPPVLPSGRVSLMYPVRSGRSGSRMCRTQDDRSWPNGASSHMQPIHLRSNTPKCSRSVSGQPSSGSPATADRISTTLPQTQL